MIEAEPIALYGLGALTVLVLLRLVYRLASLTMRVAGYTLVVAAAAGLIEPSLVEPFLQGLPQLQELLQSFSSSTAAGGEQVVRIEIGWEYVEAWQSLGYHAVLGFLGVALVYRVMEWWYPGAFIFGGLWLLGVIELDQYLLEYELGWQPWMEIYPAVVYAGAAGFGVGMVFAVALLEPSFQNDSQRTIADIDEYR